MGGGGTSSCLITCSYSSILLFDACTARVLSWLSAIELLAVAPSNILRTRSGSAYLSWNTRLRIGSGPSCACRQGSANRNKSTILVISFSSLVHQPDNHDIRIVGQHF